MAKYSGFSRTIMRQRGQLCKGQLQGRGATHALVHVPQDLHDLQGWLGHGGVVVPKPSEEVPGAGSMQAGGRVPGSEPLHLSPEHTVARSRQQEEEEHASSAPTFLREASWGVLSVPTTAGTSRERICGCVCGKEQPQLG